MSGAGPANPHFSEEAAGEVTRLLRRWADGEPAVRASLFSLLYPELKRLAQVRMRAERPDHTLQPTSLVNEFFLELARSRETNWRTRTHFLAAASQIMRRFLIDYAHAHNAEKRGGKRLKIQLDDLNIKDWGNVFDVLYVDEILDRLAAEEPRMSQIVELRCFGGLRHEEIAQIIGVDERTVKRDWKVARAWLIGQLRRRRDPHVGGRMGTD